MARGALVFVISAVLVGTSFSYSRSAHADEIHSVGLSAMELNKIKFNGGRSEIIIRMAKHVVESNAIPPEKPSVRPTVTMLFISVNGQPIFVARSVFSDLVDARNAKLRRENSLWLLSFVGGDGADTYTTEIAFDDHRVRKRATYIGLKEGRPTETIVYAPH